MPGTILTQHLRRFQNFFGVQPGPNRGPPLGFGLPLHEFAACAKQEATIVNDGPPMVGLPIVQVHRGPQRRKLDRT
jgi:hypothetical protein